MNDFPKQHRFNAFKWKILNPKREREGNRIRTSEFTFGIGA